VPTTKVLEVGLSPLSQFEVLVFFRFSISQESV